MSEVLKECGNCEHCIMQKMDGVIDYNAEMYCELKDEECFKVCDSWELKVFTSYARYKNNVTQLGLF